MDLEIKQKLTSNWFKSLQEMFCKTVSDFEKNKIGFKSTMEKKFKKMRVVVNEFKRWKSF